MVALGLEGLLCHVLCPLSHLSPLLSMAPLLVLSARLLLLHMLSLCQGQKCSDLGLLYDQLLLVILSPQLKFLLLKEAVFT